VIELDWWQVLNAGGLCITMTPAQHESGRGLLDRNRRLWGGFVVETLASRVFFSGGTGYASHFRAIRQRCGSIDVALLPIGSDEPARRNELHHLSPEEAVRAHCDLHARRTLAMSFETFSLPSVDPDGALQSALARHSVSTDQFMIPRCGESIVITEKSADVMTLCASLAMRRGG
jgi:L-ascorbate metabolism protein UlaG (beta-lactamase superfamily)